MDPDSLADGHSRTDSRTVVGGHSPLPPDPPPGLSEDERSNWIMLCHLERYDEKPEITQRKRPPAAVEDT